MNSNEIRRTFLEYFRDRGHAVVPSSSVIPSNDPTLYFANSGMVQFKDTFLGKEQRDYARAASAQKCLRVSGKHNDLEEVGRTARHHTFFEMLGNFSFGDYFKADAIRYAWDLLTNVYGLPRERLWVTVHTSDDEAEQLWKDLTDVAHDRIQRLGADNFWTMGPTGPCGPSSEIFYDHGPQYGAEGGPATGGDRYVEIWNLVFMQYERDANGVDTPLPRPSIDTGMGLERLAAALQGVYWNYDTDGLRAIVDRAAELAKVTYNQDAETDVALRVIADHSRAAAFMIADGLMPSNEGRGYELRRIMRRAIRFGVKIGLDQPFYHETVAAVIEGMGDAYPDLARRQTFILEVVKGEEERFRRTLSKGMALLNKTLDEVGDGGIVSASVAFELYATFGFPIDLTRLIAEERGAVVDQAGFDALLAEHKRTGKVGHRGSGDQAIAASVYDLAARFDTEFVGYLYDHLAGSEILALLDGEGRETSALEAGSSGVVILDRTPFYAESGGQIGDTGTVRAAEALATVTDTKKPAGTVFFHHVQVQEGRLQVGDAVELTVDADRRGQIRRNHTATHLLHAALRTVLGDHVLQKGSLVAPDRLRFDFSHHKAMSGEEVQKVEELVYREVIRNTPLDVENSTMDEAMAKGAMALFGEKYGNDVRVVSVPGFSAELCGGTHVHATGDIGLFRIVSEGGVAAGVRRVEAVTGLGAFAWVRRRDAAAAEAAAALRTRLEDVPDAVGKLIEDRKRLERELDKLRKEAARAAAGDLTTQARDVGGIRVLAAEMQGDPGTLREEAERLRDALGSAVVVLGARSEGNVQLVALVSKDLVNSKRVHAGNLVREVAKLVGGGGGGRPDMAQAGGKDPDKLPAALEQVYSLVGA